MRRAWRLIRSSHKKDAFTGEGARLAGGRWNHKDVSIVYTSENLSLAALELFVHLKRKAIKFPLVSFEIEIPDSVPVEEIPRDRLPRTWREEPPPEATKSIGSDWIKRNASAVLRVPSIIVPVEFNFLLNPFHVDFKKIKIGKPSSFSLDPRMAKD